MPLIDRLPPSAVDAQLISVTRYVVPAYLVMPAMFALVLVRLGRRWPWAAVAFTAIVVVLQRGRHFPTVDTDSLLQGSEEAAAVDTLVVQELVRQHADAVIGDYWEVYPLNFLSRESGASWYPAATGGRLSPRGRALAPQRASSS